MNSPDKSYTLEQIKDISLPLFKKYNITRASIFGSYAKEKARLDSDIDFIVEVPRGTGLFGFASLKVELEEAFGKEVDLVTFKTLKPQLRQEVLSIQKKIL